MYTCSFNRNKENILCDSKSVYQLNNLKGFFISYNEIPTLLKSPDKCHPGLQQNLQTSLSPPWILNFFQFALLTMCRILVHSNIRCTENTDQWNIYKQMKVICVRFVLFGGGFFVGFWCCFCLKSKTEVYLDLLAGFGNDCKKPRSRKNGLKKSCLFLPVAWTRHSIGLSCSCKCLDALQVISPVTEGSLDFFFKKKMHHRLYELPRTVR